MGSQYNFQVICSKFKIIFAVILFGQALILLSTAQGNDPSKIDNIFLRKYVTQVKGPRLLTNEDIRLEYEKTEMEGWSFVIEGDFNKDGHTDYAIAGKYDGPYGDKSLFVMILSDRNGKISNEFFYAVPFPHDRLFLRLEQGGNVRVCAGGIKREFDVILVAFALGTDWGYAIAWDGIKYILTKEFAYIRKK